MVFLKYAYTGMKNFDQYVSVVALVFNCLNYFFL